MKNQEESSKINDKIKIDTVFVESDDSSHFEGELGRIETNKNVDSKQLYNIDRIGTVAD